MIACEREQKLASRALTDSVERPGNQSVDGSGALRDSGTSENKTVDDPGPLHDSGTSEKAEATAEPGN